jgi:hypothetical protein
VQFYPVTFDRSTGSRSDATVTEVLHLPRCKGGDRFAILDESSPLPSNLAQIVPTWELDRPQNTSSAAFLWKPPAKGSHRHQDIRLQRKIEAPPILFDPKTNSRVRMWSEDDTKQARKVLERE